MASDPLYDRDEEDVCRRFPRNSGAHKGIPHIKKESNKHRGAHSFCVGPWSAERELVKRQTKVNLTFDNMTGSMIESVEQWQVIHCMIETKKMSVDGFLEVIEEIGQPSPATSDWESPST
ncbi:hypothetical protein QE152_g3641 [Popillia japonica]|uniref:Uncharacterized protein n=1 Tax=Popillia japonica TaxID=7064 RepID=A0AAW1N3Q8_POPJA